MRTAARPNPSRVPKALTTQIPAPVKGWTTDTPVEAEEGTALLLENWFAEPDAVRIRRGCIEYASGLSGDVSTLMGYVSGTTHKLFAADDGNIYDITAGGAVGAAAVSGLTNGWWQQTMFSTSGGQFMVIANGEDSVRNFDGTTWTTPVITGVTSSTLINVSVHKSRLWFVQSGTTDLWYLPIESIAGAASKFPVGAYLRKGGYIVATATWSVDAGNGMDDLFVAISSEGETLVYRGTDPSDADLWAIVGVYSLGDPIGRRCFFPVGGDLAIITQDGVVPISQAIKTDRAVGNAKAITKMIRQGYADAVQAAGTPSAAVQGWQIVSHPTRNMALLNIPAAGSVATRQFVMNTISGAWSLFTGWDAVSWIHHQDQLYYGKDDGTVCAAETGGTDDGEPILAYMLPSFLHLGSRGRLKHVKEVQPIYFTDVPNVTPQIAIAIDYETPTTTASAQDVSEGFFTWDVSSWDGPDVWYGLNVQRVWRGSSNIGTVISPYTYISVDASGSDAEWRFRVTAWSILFELGGVI